MSTDRLEADHASDEVQVVDVRSPAEFREGHVPGAVNVPVSEVSRRAAEFDGERNLAVCCGSGRRSREATRELAGNGAGRTVANVAGGYEAWSGGLESGDQSSDVDRSAAATASTNTGLAVDGQPVQASLTVSRPGDEHEREAERVAEQVVRKEPETGARGVGTLETGARGIETPAANERLDRVAGPVVQRQSDSESASDSPAKDAAKSRARSLAEMSDDRALAQSMGRGVIFAGSRLLVVRDGAIASGYSAEAGRPGAAPWQKGKGPIPDGEYSIRPQVTQDTVTGFEDGTGGADPIYIGYQELDVDTVKRCDPSGYRHCQIEPEANERCKKKWEATDRDRSEWGRCWNPETVWGSERIRIEGRQTVEHDGESVERSHFYIHGGYPGVATSGCIKINNSAAYSAIRKFSERVPLVVKK